MEKYEGPSGSGTGGNYRRNDTNVLEGNTQTLPDLVTLKIRADEIDKKK